MNTLRMRRIDDMHCHFRNGPLMEEVLPETAKYAGRAIAMPNTRPQAILTADHLKNYRSEIKRVIGNMPERPQFDPLMTIEIRDSTTPETVVNAHRAGAVAGKIYPRGVTTNSDAGLRDFYSLQISETFQTMADIGMLLLLHGEIDHDDILVTKREEFFLPTLITLAERFPDLRIVLEHVSSRVGVQTIMELGKNVAATITAHHLCLTLNDVLGYGVRPHHACMPTPKDFTDQRALITAATSGNSKFFLGSDSAPHPREKKESAHGACGIYTAPVLLPVLAEVFEEEEALDKLESFTAEHGADFYGLPRNPGTVTLRREEWRVPDIMGSVVPFRAGTFLRWKLS